MAFDASKFIDPDSDDGRRYVAGEAPKNPRPFIDPDSDEAKYLLAGKEPPAEALTAKQQESPGQQQGRLPPGSIDPIKTDKGQDPLTKFKDPGSDNMSQTVVQPEQKTEEPKQQGNAAMDAVAGFNLAIGTTARGLLQIMGKPFGLGQEGSSLAAVQKEEEQDYATAKENSPIAARLGYGAGVVGQAVAIPGGAATTTAGKVALGAATGAAWGGSQYVTEGESRLQNTLVGGTLGAIMPGAIDAVRGIGKLTLSGFSKGKALDDLTSTIKGTGDKAVGDARETFISARRLGTQVTPAEAVGGQGLINLEKGIRMNPATQEKAINIASQREGQLQAVKDKVISGMVPEGTVANKAATKELYSKVEHLQLPQAELSKILSDPVIEDALKMASAKKGYKLDQYAPGSIGQLDKAHVVLRDQIDALTKAGEGGLAKGLKDTDKALMKSLDNLSPDYKLARESAQRGIIHDTYLNKIDNIKNVAGEDTANITQVYDTLFSSPKLRKEFMKDVVTTGGNQQQAQDFMRVLNRIKNSPLSKLTKANIEPRAVTMGGDVTGIAFGVVKDFMRGRYNRALFENVTDPKFLDKVTQLSQIKDTPTMAQELVKILKGIKPGSVAAIAVPDRLNPE